VLLIASGFLSAWLFLQASHWLALRIEIEIAAHCLGITAVLISWVEAAQLWLPYYQYEQRVTYSSAMWADARVLRDLKLALKKDELLLPFTLLLGGLGWKHSVVLGPEHSTCHLAMFGPPRSGKSSTFFITWQRAWSGTGSVIVLDPKGELYDQTAYLFRNVYRIDLQTPERSDRWNFLPDCGGNAEFAHKVASMILDSEQSRRSTADPFWKEAEKAALTAILLQLNQLHPRPAPHMIQELISTLTLQQLNDLMMKSLDPKVPLYWGMFSKVEPKLRGRCARHRQRFALWPRWRNLVCRCGACAHAGRPAAGRARADQRRAARQAGAAWRLQAVRHRARMGPLRHRGIPQIQVGHRMTAGRSRPSSMTPRFVINTATMAKGCP
jgi:hypothetical protein